MGSIIVKDIGGFERYPAPVSGTVLGGFHSLFHLIDPREIRVGGRSYSEPG